MDAQGWVRCSQRSPLPRRQIWGDSAFGLPPSSSRAPGPQAVAVLLPLLATQGTYRKLRLARLLQVLSSRGHAARSPVCTQPLGLAPGKVPTGFRAPEGCLGLTFLEQIIVLATTGSLGHWWKFKPAHIWRNLNFLLQPHLHQEAFHDHTHQSPSVIGMLLAPSSCSIFICLCLR